jgi:hypothetical protein
MMVLANIGREKNARAHIQGKCYYGTIYNMIDRDERYYDDFIGNV